MTIRKPKTKTAIKAVDPAEIDRVIEGGEILPSDRQSPKVDRPDIKFQMVLPAELCERIDADRKPSGTSRRAWLSQRAYEYLEEKYSGSN